MKLVWTLPAREDRKTIREYIATDNPSAALDLDELLSEKAAIIRVLVGLADCKTRASLPHIELHPDLRRCR